MKYLLFVAVGLSLISSSGPQDFDVHEWGVIEFFQGVGADVSGGKDDLPDFVLTSEILKQFCSKDCRCVSGKCSEECNHIINGVKSHCPDLCSGKKCSHSELPSFDKKPILNFYTKDNIKIRVKVQVAGGKVTVWYPTHSDVKDGTVTWDNLLVTNKKPEKALKDPKGCSWWETARDTNSSYVLIKNDVEKFIFYEGETDKVKPALELKVEGDKLDISNKTQNKYNGVFVVKDKKIVYIKEFKSEKIESSKAIELNEALKFLEENLLKDGLTEREAVGVVKIWQKDLFEKDGVRVIYMMSRKEIDDALKVEITPKPKNFKRSMIAVIHDVNLIVAALVKKLGSEDVKERDAATATLIKIGKAAVPELQKTLKATKDAEVKSRLENILSEIENKKSGFPSDRDKWLVKGKHSNNPCEAWINKMPSSSPHFKKCTRCGKRQEYVNTKICSSCAKELGICVICGKEGGKIEEKIAH